jgi:quaternary ammonium compound-resistance protein SugE
LKECRRKKIRLIFSYCRIIKGKKNTGNSPRKFTFKLYCEKMNWIILIIAGLCEAGFAFCLGKAREAENGKAYWYGGFLLFLIISMLLLIKAVQSLPIGTAYAVWTGIGAAGTALMGIWLLDEPATFRRIFFIVTLIASVVGLKVVSH